MFVTMDLCWFGLKKEFRSRARVVIGVAPVVIIDEQLQ